MSNSNSIRFFASNRCGKIRWFDDKTGNFQIKRTIKLIREDTAVHVEPDK